jgi:hypothetical protein
MKGKKMKKIILSLFLGNSLLGMDEVGEELIKNAIKKTIIDNICIAPFSEDFFLIKVNQVFQFFKNEEDGYYFPLLCFKERETLFQDQILAIYDEIKKQNNNAKQALSEDEMLSIRHKIRTKNKNAKEVLSQDNNISKT